MFKEWNCIINGVSTYYEFSGTPSNSNKNYANKESIALFAVIFSNLSHEMDWTLVNDDDFEGMEDIASAGIALNEIFIPHNTNSS